MVLVPDVVEEHHGSLIPGFLQGYRVGKQLVAAVNP